MGEKRKKIQKKSQKKVRKTYMYVMESQKERVQRTVQSNTWRDYGREFFKTDDKSIKLLLVQKAKAE